MPHRILIVEDEAIVALDLASKLIQLGYEVAGTCASGEQAISLARDLQPDLVLMDMRLAGKMDGIAAAEQIRTVCRGAIIFLTAHSEPAMMERAQRVSPAAYLFKPFHTGELEMALRTGVEHGHEGTDG